METPFQHLIIQKRLNEYKDDTFRYFKSHLYLNKHPISQSLMFAKNLPFVDRTNPMKISDGAYLKRIQRFTHKESSNSPDNLRLYIWFHIEIDKKIIFIGDMISSVIKLKALENDITEFSAILPLDEHLSRLDMQTLNSPKIYLTSIINQNSIHIIMIDLICNNEDDISDIREQLKLKNIYTTVFNDINICKECLCNHNNQMIFLILISDSNNIPNGSDNLIHLSCIQTTYLLNEFGYIQKQISTDNRKKIVKIFNQMSNLTNTLFNDLFIFIKQIQHIPPFSMLKVNNKISFCNMNSDDHIHNHYLFEILNLSLRIENINNLLMHRHLIQNIHLQLLTLSSTDDYQETTTTVYRGQLMNNFVIKLIKSFMKTIWYIELEYCNINEIKENFENELGQLLSPLTFINFLNALDEYNKAEIFFNYLLDSLPSYFIPNRSVLYNNMGLVYGMNNNTQRALEYYTLAETFMTNCNNEKTTIITIDQTNVVVKDGIKNKTDNKPRPHPAGVGVGDRSQGIPADPYRQQRQLDKSLLGKVLFEIDVSVDIPMLDLSDDSVLFNIGILFRIGIVYQR
ncbi:unnamed protein product [Didymodactylos carnosus]|uniref:Uncharacterized protein n=1 Tax=Didymodactylos carnosus TaxID=1234261 RepID=A0A814WII2_9BILA|nr:unnamed protein product [Didymodactylos carnosus]CAF3970156.1 unnamed protein product [Didymodactylos carnosus]